MFLRDSNLMDIFPFLSVRKMHAVKGSVAHPPSLSILSGLIEARFVSYFYSR